MNAYDLSLKALKCSIWSMLTQCRVIFMRCQLARHWRRHPPDKSSGPKVSYGHMYLPSSGEFATGGIVKTQDLAMRFPHAETGAAVLYLISSALDEFSLVSAQEAKRAGVAVILNQNGVAYPAWKPDGAEQVNRDMKAVLNVSDYVFYQSCFAKEGADRFLCKRDVNFEILYNAVDTQRFAPSGARSDAPELLVAGSHSHAYRIRTAIECLSAVRAQGIPVRMTIAGVFKWGRSDEGMRQEVLDMIDACCVSGCVDLAGPYTQAAAVSLYQSAKVLLHPQCNDVCPSVVLEAMACGLPIVYPDCGGTSELVSDIAGVGVPNGSSWAVIDEPDPKLLAGAVVSVMDSHKKYSDAARNRVVEKFSLQHWLKRHEAVFKEYSNTKKPM